MVGVLLGIGIGLGSAPVARAECGLGAVVGCEEQAPPPAPEPEPAPAPPAAPATPSPAEAAARLLVLANEARAEAGVPALAARSDVAAIAQGWSESMGRSGVLAHNDDYFTPETKQQLDAGTMAENVAYAGDPDHAHRTLMASPAHRANLLDARLTVVGMGAVQVGDTWWVTQDFLHPRSTGTAKVAAPASVAPVPPPASTTTAPAAQSTATAPATAVVTAPAAVAAPTVASTTSARPSLPAAAPVAEREVTSSPSGPVRAPIAILAALVLVGVAAVAVLASRRAAAVPALLSA